MSNLKFGISQLTKGTPLWVTICAYVLVWMLAEFITAVPQLPFQNQLLKEWLSILGPKFLVIILFLKDMVGKHIGIGTPSYSDSQPNPSQN